MHFKDNENEDDDQERLIVIRGLTMNVHRAELEIKRIILDVPKTLSEYYYVPESACGYIIGRSGANIREISSLSNCRVKVHDDINQSKILNTIKQEIKLITNPDSSSPNGIAGHKLMCINGNAEQILHAKVNHFCFEDLFLEIYYNLLSF
jgi:hypothetical protein